MKNYKIYFALLFIYLIVPILPLQSQSKQTLPPQVKRKTDPMIVQVPPAQSLQSLPIQAKRKIDPMLVQAVALKENFPSESISAVEVYDAGKRMAASAGDIVGVLVRASSDISDYIHSIGGVIGSKHGDIYTALIPLNSVAQTAQHTSVSYIEASRRLHSSLDLSRAKTGADVLHTLPDPNQRLTGKDVIIGFTDSGINIDHPTFRLSDGRTRILYIWNQYATSGGNPPEGYTYGVELDSSFINALHQPMDISGGFHGTHVAGIAAGNGLPSGQYTGMAPEADIIMVINKADDLLNHGVTTVGALDGYDYIRTKAQTLGKRFVINTSQGTNLGPHDGTTLFEKAVNADVAAGNIHCISAGNSADKALHASAVVTTTSSQTIECSFNDDALYYALDIWYKQNDRINLSFQDAYGYESSIFFPAVDTTFTCHTEFWAVTATITIGSPLNGDNEILLHIFPSYYFNGFKGKFEFSAADGNTLPDGGRVDLWWERDIPVNFVSHIDQSITLSMPACADSAIIVASYNNRNDYCGLEDDISSFSALGPRRDGVLKPDITGIGGSVTSAIWSDQYGKSSGTSMSSPHVAGAIALLLQQDSTLTNYQVKQKLFTSATADMFTGPVPNPAWGYGKLNVLKAAGYQGIPIISVAEDTMRFENLFVGLTTYDTVVIKNLGSEELLISNVSTSNPTISVNKTSFIIPPHTQELLIVGITATIPSDLSETIIVTCNDQSNPTTTIVAICHSQYPPDASVSPDAFSYILNRGDSTEAVMNISNSGLGHLNYMIGIDYSMPTQAPMSSMKAVMPSDWTTSMKFQTPADLDSISPLYATNPLLPVIIQDPIGDASEVDISEIRGKITGGMLMLQIVCATPLNVQKFSGYLALDIDQNPATGYSLPPPCDIGAEYFIYFNYLYKNYVTLYDLYSYRGKFVPSIDIEGKNFMFSIPLTSLGNDDGRINLASLLGTHYAPTDSVPDDGYGTIGSSWLSAVPLEGTIAPGSSVSIHLKVSAAGMEGGDYPANLVVESNDPFKGRVQVPVQLNVVGVPELVTPDSLKFRTVYIGYPDTLDFNLRNYGSDVLSVTNLSVNDPQFSIVGSTSFTIAPIAERAVRLAFNPNVVGDISTQFSIVSDDPVTPTRVIPVTAKSAYAPIITALPDSLSVTIYQGEHKTETITISNSGGSILLWNNSGASISNSLSAYSRPVYNQGIDKYHRITGKFETDHRKEVEKIQTTAFMPGLADDFFNRINEEEEGKNNTILSLPVPAGNFFDGFEDGNIGAWSNDGETGIREVTNSTAAEGAYSFHYIDQGVRELCKGISRSFAENYRPEYVGFYVRTGYIGYTGVNVFFRLDGNSSGQQAISFFADFLGKFYVNTYVAGGDYSFIFNTYQWYHIEFRNIDWVNKNFDYYVDNQLIKADIPFINAGTVNQFERLYLCNYRGDEELEAWWDGIDIRVQANWITLNPGSGNINPGSTQDVTVEFDAMNLSPGDWSSVISITSNDPENNSTLIPVKMHVIGKEVIVVEPDTLKAGITYVGTAHIDTVKVKNVGSEELNVTNITSNLPEFTINLTDFTVPPGEEQAVPITFDPIDTLSYNGILTITSNDSHRPTVEIGLQGQGAYPPVIAASPESLAVALKKGETATRTVTISNSGRGNLNFNSRLAYRTFSSSSSSSASSAIMSSMSGSSINAGAQYVPNQVLIKFKNGNFTSQAKSIRSQLKATIAKKFSRTGAELWNLSGMSVEDAIVHYKNNPHVKYIEPNYIRHTYDRIPSDPLFVQLWGMQKIEAPRAWEQETGTDIVIGDIDSGIDPSHPDLSANLWTNPGEIPSNGIDDDANGYIDDIHGWNFCNNTNNVVDGHGHGTHTAGTIAAVGNNNIGVTGVCWSAKIMVLKFLDATGYGTDAGAIAAIEYATRMGARLTNNSWGGGPYSQAMYDAIEEARDAGILFVAAAGNEGWNTDDSPIYPACYNLDNIISVAATTSDDNMPTWSNCGIRTVDLGAPGENIYSTIRGGSYGSGSGTSMAAPHVSGLAGLILSVNPLLDWAAVKDIILSSVDLVPSLADRTVTGGRLNAATALQNTRSWLTFSPASGTVVPGSSVELTVLFDAANISVGTYRVDIEINSNDTLNNPKTIPVTMNVEGPIVISLNVGWNIVSVPAQVADLSVESVFPNIIGGIAYAYNTTRRNYDIVTTLEYGRGYWAYFLEPHDIVFQGSVFDSLSMSLAPSWNMASAISYSVAKSDIITNPSTYLTWYGFQNGGYYAPDSIQPGTGYWVANILSSPCMITIKKSNSLSKGLPSPTQGGTSVSAYDKFTVTDSSGNQQSLFVANLEREPILAQMNLAMPPAFSEAKFDVRFESGEMIKVLSAKAQTELGIAVKAEASIVDISWELQAENGFSYEIVTEGSNSVSVKGTGSLSMARPVDGKIRLQAIGSGKGAKTDLPREYALAQNYPNPFNPVTTIKYQLPERAGVKLEVFNILGQRVAMLVNAEQEAGYYQMPFDAKALSSGIYFYRISAGSYVKSQKMMLLR